MSTTDNAMRDRMTAMAQDRKDIKTAMSLAKEMNLAHLEYYKACEQFLSDDFGNEIMAQRAVFFIERMRRAVGDNEEAIAAELVKAWEVRVPSQHDELQLQARQQKIMALRQGGFVVDETHYDPIVHYEGFDGEAAGIRMNSISEIDSFIARNKS